MSKPKSVFLRGFKRVNHQWVKKTAKEDGMLLSGFMNKIVEDARKNRSKSK